MADKRDLREHALLAGLFFFTLNVPKFFLRFESQFLLNDLKRESLPANALKLRFLEATKPFHWRLLSI